jgi:hypothetical protein
MQELAKALGKRAQEMKQKGDAYFAAWEEGRASSAGNPPDQKLAERKRSYDAINKSMQDAKANFMDFVAVLDEIKSLLEGERTSAAVARAKSIFGKANWSCIDVQKALMYVEQELDRLAESFGSDS